MENYQQVFCRHPTKAQQANVFRLGPNFFGVVAAFVGALIVALDKSGQQTKVATVTGPVAPSGVAPVTQNPIPPISSPVRAAPHSSATIESLSPDQRNALARDLYKLKSSIPIIYLTESGVQPGLSPVAISMIDLASWLGSLGRWGG
jgi:hypothetical protein